MDILRLERRATSVIAWITILTGMAQIGAPTALLPLLGVDPAASAAQLFGTIGMFMMLFGGAVLHAQSRREALPVVLLWSAFQKVGASLLVTWGVSGGVFAPLTLLVAAFDFASGLLFIDLRRRGG
jgi:hypothetical protein